jgi:hypothetical protein
MVLFPRYLVYYLTIISAKSSEEKVMASRRQQVVFFNTYVYEQSPKSLHQVVLTSILQSSAG